MYCTNVCIAVSDSQPLKINDNLPLKGPCEMLVLYTDFFAIKGLKKRRKYKRSHSYRIFEKNKLNERLDNKKKIGVRAKKGQKKSDR